MSIKVGDKLPSVQFKQFTSQGLGEVSTDDIFANKRVILFGIPGAFTPVCQGNHLPGYVARADEMKQRGLDEIVCVSVNDTFVTNAFGEAGKADGKVRMLADSTGDFTRKLGMDTDGSSFGLGTRSERLAMLVDNGTVKSVQVEAKFVDHDVSSADNMVKILTAA
ncbi:MAG: redoxin family protein [Pseudomonadota bacterium]|nr:redoxin family protein [Pseudomonadota bacterium]